MRVRCIQSVVMIIENPYQAFTEGKEYRTYRWAMKDYYDIIPTICAKNDKGERHVIRYEDSNYKGYEETEKFFKQHFVTIR